MEIKYFDDRVREWDNDPAKIERAFILAKEIKTRLQPEKSTTAFELGCGNGLLGYFLRDSFKSITLADSSEDVIKVLKDRINNERISNLNPLLLDLLTHDVGSKEYDVIYTLMTLHHITDLDTILFKFSRMLRDKGYLCIADLEKEDGTFHENMSDFQGHQGFEKENLEKMLIKHGFRICLYKTFYKIEKTLNNNRKKKFPLFMLMAQK
ncbi:MAG TPA: class I SAM-dependent methyltransferase [Bacteroidales bacterium]|nr:class I SAM-dependent methyltransferase [Bacteroidales bacterium]